MTPHAPQDRLESVSCLHCGSIEAEFWAEENGFRAWKCSRCGLVYVNPRPAADARQMSVHSGIHEGEEVLDVKGDYAPDVLKPRYRRILNEIYAGELRRSDIRWLDIGCGYGEFLETIAEFSRGRARLAGIEPNDVKRDSCGERGIRVSPGPQPSEPGPYDFVSLLNVYSHLPDPRGFLKATATLLGSGGELLLETGNGGEIERSRFPFPLDLPDHLSFASEAVLGEMLSEAGFEVIRVERYPIIRIGTGHLSRAKHFVKAALFPEYRRIYWKNPCRDLWIRARKR